MPCRGAAAHGRSAPGQPGILEAGTCRLYLLHLPASRPPKRNTGRPLTSCWRPCLPPPSSARVPEAASGPPSPCSGRSGFWAELQLPLELHRSGAVRLCQRCGHPVRLWAAGRLPDSSFRPEQSITRGEFAVLLASALNLRQSGSAGFTDVPSDAWYTKAVDAMVAKGFLAGRSSTSFAPQDSLTYEELVTILSAVSSWACMDCAMADQPIFSGQQAAYAGLSDWAQAPAWRLSAPRGGAGSQRSSGSRHPGPGRPPDLPISAGFRPALECIILSFYSRKDEFTMTKIDIVSGFSEFGDRHRRRLSEGRRCGDHRDELRLHLLLPGGRLRRRPEAGAGPTTPPTASSSSPPAWASCPTSSPPWSGCREGGAPLNCTSTALSPWWTPPRPRSI